LDDRKAVVRVPVGPRIFWSNLLEAGSNDLFATWHYIQKTGLLSRKSGYVAQLHGGLHPPILLLISPKCSRQKQYKRINVCVAIHL
jgi:hypothetical protein